MPGTLQKGCLAGAPRRETAARVAKPADSAKSTSPASPARRTQSQRREEAERRLLDAALGIVARAGSARLTLAEVGAAAGYSRGLATHRFGNKAGLLRALAAHINVRFHEQLRAAPPRRAGLDAIRGNISVYFGRSDRNWTTTRALLVMMTEGFMEGAELKSDMAAYNRLALAFFEQHLKSGVAQGEIAADIEPASMAVLLLGSLRGVMLQWLLDDAIDLGAVRDRLLAMVDLTLARGV